MSDNGSDILYVGALEDIADAIESITYGIIRKDQPTSFYTELAASRKALEALVDKPPELED